MSRIKIFTFNPFQENTYVLHSEKGNCIIVDPGCYDETERNRFLTYIRQNDLKPKRLINTHCHLDHIFGNAFIYEEFGLKPEFHQGELEMYSMQEYIARSYGLQISIGPKPEVFLRQDDYITLDEISLKLLFAPGHSAASLCLYDAVEGYVIAGDVLFRESIGRTDLPGGDYDTLISSIRRELLPLDDAIIVYSGHGPQTTIGHERRYNPFIS